MMKDIFAFWKDLTPAQATFLQGAALEMGLYSRLTSPKPRLGGTIQLWFLQSHAHIYPYRTDCDGSVQTQKLVYILPHGLYDTGNL
ncbi:MAG: hypothetical protein II684_01970 [Treponema sp.]|nr:hypothetical protein [Treponema sp.]